MEPGAEEGAGTARTFTLSIESLPHCANRSPAKSGDRGSGLTMPDRTPQGHDAVGVLPLDLLIERFRFHPPFAREADGVRFEPFLQPADRNPDGPTDMDGRPGPIAAEG